MFDYNTMAVRRFNRDPMDDLLKWRMENPEEAAKKDAVAAEEFQRKVDLIDLEEKAAKKKMAAELVGYGDWAVVAEVLMAGGLVGDDLAREMEVCRTEADNPDAWMRANF